MGKLVFICDGTADLHFEFVCASTLLNLYGGTYFID